jgi:hypothetical protein
LLSGDVTADMHDRISLARSGFALRRVLKYEEKGNPREECPMYLDELRTAFE